jgi:zinc protease
MMYRKYPTRDVTRSMRSTLPKVVFLSLASVIIAASCVSNPPGSTGPAISSKPDYVATPATPVAPAADTNAWIMPQKPVSGWKLPTKPSAYMTANLQTIETRILSNGVKLIVKKNPANRVFSMKVAYRGGSAMTTPEKAGIEAMTLAMLARGSARYPYAELQRLQYELSSSIGFSAAGYDMASFDLNTIDKYWDQMYGAFADCVLAPAFDPAQFSIVQNDFRVSIQKTMADPYNYAVSKLHDRMFHGHPYQADFQGTAASVASITLDDVKAYYAETMGPGRMFVVAVGNFDTDKLAAILDATIGAMPKKDTPVPTVGNFVPHRELYLEAFEKSKGIAYVRGDYPIADVKSPDYVTLQLAYSILDELLFSIVRTDHGACYSTWSRAFASKAPYGSIVVYKTSQPGEVKQWLDEAIALLASGKTLNIHGGPDKYAPIASTIEAYKAKYVNAFFGNQQTNAETAAQIASSQLYFGNHAEYLKFIDKIGAVTPGDVVAAVKSYVIKAPITWIVVADQATLSKVDKAKYEAFTGTVE